MPVSSLPTQALSAFQGCLFPSFSEEMPTSVQLKSQSSVKVTFFMAVIQFGASQPSSKKPGRTFSPFCTLQYQRGSFLPSPW